MGGGGGLHTMQRGIFTDIFAPVHSNKMSTQFLCAQSYTANIFVYTTVCALAKCNLFESVARSVMFGLSIVLIKKSSQLFNPVSIQK